MKWCGSTSPAINGVTFYCQQPAWHSGACCAFAGVGDQGKVTWEYGDTAARGEDAENNDGAGGSSWVKSPDPVVWPNVRRSCGHVDDKSGWNEEQRGLFEKTVCGRCVRGDVLRTNAPGPVTLAELLSRLDALVALARHERFELFAVVLEREGKFVRDFEGAFRIPIDDRFIVSVKPR